MNTTLLSVAKLNARFTEILSQLHFEKKNLLGWLSFSQSFDKDSDVEVATSWTANVVVDVTFMPHDNPEIP